MAEKEIGPLFNSDADVDRLRTLRNKLAAELSDSPAGPGAKLTVVPVDWPTTRGFVDDWHRHNQPPVGWKFGIGVATDDGLLRGVAVISRPIARAYDNGYTLEVTRCTTDGTPNACSCLYGAAWRAVKAMGYRRLITYTRMDEPGVSLRATNWHAIAERPQRRGWDTPSRRRGSDYDAIPRTLWEAQ